MAFHSEYFYLERRDKAFALFLALYLLQPKTLITCDSRNLQGIRLRCALGKAGENCSGLESHVLPGGRGTKKGADEMKDEKPGELQAVSSPITSPSSSPLLLTVWSLFFRDSCVCVCVLMCFASSLDVPVGMLTPFSRSVPFTHYVSPLYCLFPFKLQLVSFHPYCIPIFSSPKPREHCVRYCR